MDEEVTREEFALVASLSGTGMERALAYAVETAMGERGIPCSVEGTVVDWVSVPRDRVREARDLLLTDPRFQGQMIVFYDENTGERIFPPEQVPHWSFDDRWRQDLVLVARVSQEEGDLLGTLQWIVSDHDIPYEFGQSESLEIEIWVSRAWAQAARDLLKTHPELRGKPFSLVEDAENQAR